MKRWLISIMVGIGLFGISNFKALAGCEFPICPTGHYGAISDRKIVWADTRKNFWLDADIYGYDLTTRTEFPISIDSSNASEPAISGNTVVWSVGYPFDQTTYDIYGYNLLTQTKFPICTNNGCQDEPAVSGDIVVWRDNSNGNWDILGKNLLTEQSLIICDNLHNQHSPAISGEIVVWQDDRNGNWDIYGKNLDTGKEFSICTAQRDQMNPDISSISSNLVLVVWQDYRNQIDPQHPNCDIFGKNLDTSQELIICTVLKDQTLPAISGNLVVWQDARNDNGDIYGKYLDNNQEIEVCKTSGWQSYPAISDNFVCWNDNRNIPSGELFGRDLADTSPPQITCMADKTISVGSGGTALCPSIVSSSSYGVTIVQNPTAGTELGVGSHLITATATDCEGRTSSCSSTITVSDNVISIPLYANCWHHFSLPQDPLYPDPQDIFPAEAVLDGYLSRYDGSGYVTYESFDPEPFGEMKAGDGYWFYTYQSDLPLEIRYVPIPSFGDQEINLPYAGWYMIGSHQLGDVLIENCSVRNNNTGQTLPFKEAWLNGWVQDPLFHWDCSFFAYIPYGVDIVDYYIQLQQSQAYWLYTYQPNLTLVVP